MQQMNKITISKTKGPSLKAPARMRMGTSNSPAPLIPKPQHRADYQPLSRISEKCPVLIVMLLLALGGLEELRQKKVKKYIFS